MEAGGLELAERVRWRPEACLVSEVARPLPWPRSIPYIRAGYRLLENIRNLTELATLIEKFYYSTVFHTRVCVRASDEARVELFQ